MNSQFLQSKFAVGLSYADYLKTGTSIQQENWTKIFNQAHLTAAQTQLLGSFTRRINVLALSGIWCGDCVQQGPLIQRIALTCPPAGNGGIDLRWLDRDLHKDLQQQVRINGGDRVPVAIFCSEDYELVGWFGDRTLNRYRALAARHLGASCPLPGAAVSPDELAGTLQDWVDQFERVHLLLRLSTRLRQKYRD